MKLRTVRTKNCSLETQILINESWIYLSEIIANNNNINPIGKGVLDILALSSDLRNEIMETGGRLAPSEGGENIEKVEIPFQPLSYRDFLLWEKHYIDSARGFAKKFYPKFFPIIKIYETVLRKPFPAFIPKGLWYKQPIYYMGNHLAFETDGYTIPIPDYCTVLDYELEFGIILSKPLFNATPDEAEKAIGGFTLFNDISARNVQRAEMKSGFGLQKAKNFCNIMGSVVVTADEILPIWKNMNGQVKINDETVARVNTAGAQFSLGECVAFVSKGEKLYPGEFFGSGTIPGGSGIENGFLLQAGDKIEMSIENIGSVTNYIGYNKDENKKRAHFARDY